jgi:glutamate synthase domain-containing protein 2
VRGLVVAEKWQRVRNYHQHMLDDFLQLMAASGCHSLEEMNQNLIYRKVDKHWLSYAEVVKAR